MKILTDNLTVLEKKRIEENMEHEEIKEVSKKEEGLNAIKVHFGTLKCKSDDYLTDKGELWIVYPPKGVYGETLNILIK